MPNVSLRKTIKNATGSHLWTRYVFLAPWRLAYATLAQFTNRVSTGECDRPDHAETIFTDYKRRAGVERFHGRVAEVGPGNVSGVALMLLADGCSHVDQVDPFSYDVPSNPRISRYQVSAEEFFLNHSGYDFILSCAVMEHLYNPLAALRAMAGALNPGGMMIHSVDCRDHGQFSDMLHDLSFLCIPRVLYKPLELASGLNRVRPSGYVQIAHESGLDFSLLVTGLSGVPGGFDPVVEFDCIDPSVIEQSRQHLAPVKQKLAKPFRHIDEKDLLIAGFVLVARRPPS